MPLAKDVGWFCASLRGLKYASAIASLVVIWLASPVAAQDAAKSTLPRFRSIDVDAAPNLATVTVSPIRLLADEDFAPWSFKLADGSLTGISVELARTACLEGGLTCSIVATPHNQLLSRLNSGEGEMIITGLKLDDRLIATHNATKPYFRSMARFIMTKGTDLKGLDPRTLAGVRIGVVKNTAHHAFLIGHYSRSALVTYDTPAAFYDALRNKQVDVGFADALSFAFWQISPQAQNCCDALGGSVIDTDTFSRPLVFLARQDLGALRDWIDDTLDSLESKGQTAAIFMRFLPSPIW